MIFHISLSHLALAVKTGYKVRHFSVNKMLLPRPEGLVRATVKDLIYYGYPAFDAESNRRLAG